MKKTLFIFGFLLLSYAQASATTCFDLEKDKLEQVVKLENAKNRIFEQEESFINLIRNKKESASNTIASSTQSRVDAVRDIVSELESLKKSSRSVLSAIDTLTLSTYEYATQTAIALATFNDSVTSITSDRTKSIKNIIDQYENDLFQTYERSILECKDSTFEINVFDTKIKSIRKRVVDSQKNTRRMSQGIDAAYAKLNFELDLLDANLNKSLKSVRPILKRELSFTEAPLSLLHLIRTL